ncbi:MAG: Hint domain-containing protein, partial [Minisyncoccia bacterium]
NGFGYQIGSFIGPIDPNLLPIAICFPCQTPVVTDQGEVHIDKLKPDIHTIQGKRIVSILETAPNFKNMVCIEKNALGNNCPSQRTEMSPDHRVQYNGQLIKAKDLVDVCEGVHLIPFIREKIYNVLMEHYDTIIVNNMITETLHPDNVLVQIATSNEYTAETKLELCKEYERLLMT